MLIRDLFIHDHYKKVKKRNLYLGLKNQLPIKRFLKNFFITGNAWGMFSIYSHTMRKDGIEKPKIMYNTKESALKAAQSLSKKRGVYFSTYKCIFCDGYHIGRNSNNK